MSNPIKSNRRFI